MSLIVLRWRSIVLIAFGFLIASCAAPMAPDTDHKEEVTGESNSWVVEGRVIKRRKLVTGSLFKRGTLYVVNSNEVVPWDALRRLKQHGWRGSGYEEELRPLIAYPAQRAYSLIYVHGEARARISSIDNLWWKVQVEDEEDAAAFLDLIGGPLTKPYFEDARGWEVRRQTVGWSVPGLCVLPESEFERLGLRDRSIEKVHGGFVVRRAMFVPEVTRSSGGVPFYWPRELKHPSRLVQSREFVSTEGFYLFGIDRVVSEADDCPVITLPDRDAMELDFLRNSI